ncbi:MAG: 16S rRNA (cytosine(1402)-N(4))-methyltransferase RsmH [Brachymonas sp.]|nr:16S rRNA (cytosine(1402)-N(4))-methyltransferase RsmH [Brachymonas sp.]
MGTENKHLTVMLQEAVDALVHDARGSYVDGTFGRGGHSRAVLGRLAPEGRLLAFDKDTQAVAHAQATMDDSRFSIRHASFAEMAELPDASVDGILLDLGVSSPQIDTPDRGFSFRHDGPLDMRMDTTRGQSVAQWLATAEQAEIVEVIRDYGEERFAAPIAKAIVARRQEPGGITRTSELAQLVAGAVKTREPGQDPATRTFQALRIFINAELEELRQALDTSLRILRPAGTLVIISFHSLEDRIVKQFMVQHSKTVFDRRQPALPQHLLGNDAVCKLRQVRRMRPSAHEVAANPRARSAVLRAAVRNGDAA